MNYVKRMANLPSFLVIVTSPSGSRSHRGPAQPALETPERPPGSRLRPSSFPSTELGMARGRRRVLSFVGWFWSDRSVVACDFAPFPECLSALLFAQADCDCYRQLPTARL